ncbi:CLUMA_CG015068, isoform A [Clunio marinus]|uniref:CLUMA_CG015068, isoform A n=1 Tax=Clunio marinus TaxID=568069 RepID=A0A1J1IQD8_9DIPT|nr:CLUMA_CG015068, isoform A [Clunio marinus]
MEQFLEILLFLSFIFSTTIASVNIDINFRKESESRKKLPRFWTNTGFAPTQPIENAADFLESDDVNLNLEFIGSLPNNGIRNVRIHWLLNMISLSYSNGTQFPTLNFNRLDKFLWKLINDYRLNPTIEFMTTLKFKKLNTVIWEDFAYQVISRYIGRYGVKNVRKWKLETWNEPDLDGYNLLNFTNEEFIDYMKGISEGIKAVERQFSLNNTLKLRGPAGLFKDERKHKFCWGVLENCNKFPVKCPIDIITFHRKGNGNTADEVLNESLDLIEDFKKRFKNLTTLKYSNTEADPIKKWSEPRDFQSDSRYAVILTEIIFSHWQALYDGRMKNLESISHDNSFLNFYPNFFTQRTLLARFQMNNTTPKHVQFIQKPVFGVLGLIANLATHAGRVHTLNDKNISYLVTLNNRSESFYSCIVIWSHVNLKVFSNKSKTFDITIQNIIIGNSINLFYIGEGIDNRKTNPSAIFDRNSKPPFPDFSVFEEMRAAQDPTILVNPTKVVDGKIILNLRLMRPFVVVIRICDKNVTKPKKVFNLRLRRINSEEIVLFWSDSFYKERCLKTYEIFFKYLIDDDYKQIETRHIPFLNHQLKHTIPGCFKIRSRDIFDRVSKLSTKICFNET